VSLDNKGDVILVVQMIQGVIVVEGEKEGT